MDSVSCRIGNILTIWRRHLKGSVNKGWPEYLPPFVFPLTKSYVSIMQNNRINVPWKYYTVLEIMNQQFQECDSEHRNGIMSNFKPIFYYVSIFRSKYRITHYICNPICCLLRQLVKCFVQFWLNIYSYSIPGRWQRGLKVSSNCATLGRCRNLS